MSKGVGLIHIYTGNGKGKTTCALGLGLRAIGAGLKVHMIQFMKGQPTSEINSIDGIPSFTVERFGRDSFIKKGALEKEDLEEAAKGLAAAEIASRSGEFDLVILDELCCAVDFGLVGIEAVLDLIARRNANCEIVLTGRNASAELIAVADLVTEMREIKHPYMQGIAARRGFDY